MKYWHLQMHLPEGKGGRKINSRDMLHEVRSVIGTGEWDNKQCTDFKNIMAIGDIVLVREGNRAIALCRVAGDNFTDSTLTSKYININYREVEILEEANNDTIQPRPGLFSQGTLSPCNNLGTEQYKFIENWYKSILIKQQMTRFCTILEKKKNIILQGAPGTGKTYITASLALRILGDSTVYSSHAQLMEAYERKRKEGQIKFVTFHQSMDYEDFVEGLKPVMNDDEMSAIHYKIENGIFKSICDEARKETFSDTEDNFEESWKKLVSDLDEKGSIEISSLTYDKKFTVELNSNGDGLADRIPTDGDRTAGYSRFYNHDQLYNVYRGLPGTPKGGHDNYRRAVINYMKENYGLKKYSEGQTKKTNIKNYVLIIDEINRGNVSKIFGELITLLEADKRVPVGEKQPDNMHTIKVTLPYSKQEFSVPSNLYIIGTMNTTDRSVGCIDYAVRRRFAFVTLKSDIHVIEQNNQGETLKMSIRLYNAVHHFLEKNKLDLDIDDLMVGHSYFLCKNDEELKLNWQYEIYPLLNEYYRDGICRCAPVFDMEQFINSNSGDSNQ